MTLPAPRPRRAREERALATRRRILRAAYALFSSRGYAATTMEAIAAEAGVAVQTLYFTFRTKAAILGETVGACVIGFDAWAPIKDPIRTGDPDALRRHHDWWAAFEAEADGRRALAIYLDATMKILARVSPIAAVVQAAAASDEGVRVLRDVGEDRRVESYAAVVAELAKKNGGLARGIGKRRATDILLTVLSAETYEHLVIRRGWTPREARTWFLDLLSSQLLGRD